MNFYDRWTTQVALAATVQSHWCHPPPAPRRTPTLFFSHHTPIPTAPLILVGRAVFAGCAAPRWSCLYHNLAPQPQWQPPSSLVVSWMQLAELRTQHAVPSGTRVTGRRRGGGPRGAGVRGGCGRRGCVLLRSSFQPGVTALRRAFEESPGRQPTPPQSPAPGAKPRTSIFLPGLRLVWHWTNPHAPRSR